ncbi:hypothetical protein Zmor_010331 [Zophobas morio]|uniref:Uncharacterized protein n=1 Tax=Zophobas morio TaxID=2755281 RepID=A0AA38IRJ2_9CUCU|nr:hypothetical protein Zmor_010331 [Zophobas morio]
MGRKMDTRNKEIDEKMRARMEKVDEKMDVEAKKNEIEEIKKPMKVRKTIVGRNMVRMEEKVKEIEKSMKERVEDRIKTIEDRMKIIEDRIENRMKTFEKIIKNAATTGSCDVTSASRTIQPPINDGQTPWSSYKIQSEAAATANS